MPFEKPLSPEKKSETEQHADTRCAESVGPAIDLAQPSAQQSGGKGANVDSHVKNGETGISSRVIIRVKFSDHS